MVISEFTGERDQLIEFLTIALQLTEYDLVRNAARRVEALGLRELIPVVAGRARDLEPGGYGPISSCAARLKGEPEPEDPDEWGI